MVWMMYCFVAPILVTRVTLEASEFFSIISRIADVDESTESDITTTNSISTFTKMLPKCIMTLKRIQVLMNRYLLAGALDLRYLMPQKSLPVRCLPSRRFSRKVLLMSPPFQVVIHSN